jgi:hypothetical protein
MATARIRLERARGGYTDRLRAYQVMLDGTLAGQVKRGQTLVLETEPGTHHVQLTIDWAKSQLVQVELQPGQEVRLRCWPKANAVSALYRATLGASDYIGLEVVDQA